MLKITTLLSLISIAMVCAVWKERGRNKGALTKGKKVTNIGYIGKSIPTVETYELVNIGVGDLKCGRKLNYS